MIALLVSVALAGSPDAPLPTEGEVVSVYDGDTLTLDTGDRIRLRWVNTPELKPAEPFGDAARAFTTDFVLHRHVRLAVAPEGRDGYGRVLAGVQTDGGDLSLALLEAGLGHVFVIPPDPTDTAPLLAAEARARAARRGLWADPAFQGPLHVTSLHANAPGDDTADVNGEYLRVCNISGAPLDLTGWSIRDASERSFPLPAVVVPAGHTVRIHAGRGPDQLDPASALVAYLGSPTPLFDNEGDRAEVVGPDGRAVDVRVHAASSDGRASR